MALVAIVPSGSPRRYIRYAAATPEAIVAKTKSFLSVSRSILSITSPAGFCLCRRMRVSASERPAAHILLLAVRV